VVNPIADEIRSYKTNTNIFVVNPIADEIRSYKTNKVL